MRATRSAPVVAALAALWWGAGCRDAPGPAAAGGAAAVHQPSWTPEEAELLFMSDRDGNAEIYLQRGVGGEWVNLSRHPGGDNWPEWSPDGQHIAFQSRRDGHFDIWRMNADGSDPVRLTDDPAHDYLASWSPDGERITFTSWRREPGDEETANHIYVMNADGSDQRRLVSWSPGVSAGAPWSPDGETVVLTRKRGEKGSDLFLADLDGGHERRLTDDGAFHGSPSFSPDGSRLAFYSDDGESSDLVVMNVDGSGRRAVVEGGWSWYPSWSPDGRWLVYTSAVPGGEDGDLDVYAVEVDGGEPIRLVGGPGREGEGRWRPAS